MPTLKRVDLVGTQLTDDARSPKASTTLRIEYGFDIDGDGSPDTYLDGARRRSGRRAALVERRRRSRCTSSPARSTRRSAANLADRRRNSTSAASRPIATAADGYARSAYSSAIRLINPSAGAGVAMSARAIAPGSAARP